MTNTLGYKNYINALQEYEKSNNSIEQITCFITLRDKSILSKLSLGIVMIPSPNLLKQSLLSLKHINLDKSTLNLYDHCIFLSQRFYDELIHSIIKAKIEKLDYNSHFNQMLQTYGIEFIEAFDNLSKHMRSRYSQKLYSKQFWYILLLCSLNCAMIVLMFLYFESILYGIIGYMILTLILVSLFTLNTKSTKDAFTKSDIYGQNIVGRKYRVHLNNIVKNIVVPNPRFHSTAP